MWCGRLGACLVGFAATFLIVRPQNTNTYCPLQFLGFMNGRFYYYCTTFDPATSTDHCPGPKTTASTKVQKKIGCNPTTHKCVDPFTGGGEPAKHADDSPQLERICKKKVGDPGEGDLAEDSFLHNQNVTIHTDIVVHDKED